MTDISNNIAPRQDVLLKAIPNNAKIADVMECLRDGGQKKSGCIPKSCKKLQKPPQNYNLHAKLVRERGRGAKAEEGLNVE